MDDGDFRTFGFGENACEVVERVGFDCFVCADWEPKFASFVGVEAFDFGIFVELGFVVFDWFDIGAWVVGNDLFLDDFAIVLWRGDVEFDLLVMSDKFEAEDVVFEEPDSDLVDDVKFASFVEVAVELGHDGDAFTKIFFSDGFFVFGCVVFWECDFEEKAIFVLAFLILVAEKPNKSLEREVSAEEAEVEPRVFEDFGHLFLVFVSRYYSKF